MHFPFRRALLSFAVLGGLCLSGIVHAQTFDATADYGPGVSNPNGVWKYGYTTTLGGSFTLFDQYLDDPEPGGTLAMWRVAFPSGGAALIAQNNTPNNFAGVDPGQLYMHPGPLNQFAVLRFVAPSTGVFDVAGAYFTGDSGNTDAYLLENSGSPLFSTGSTTGGGTFSFTGLSLTQNDTIDLAIGTGGDNWFSDSTPINLVVTQTTEAVPEPGAIGLLAGVGIFSGALMIRRRRHFRA
jgi:hypothetical protein